MNDGEKMRRSIVLFAFTLILSGCVTHPKFGAGDQSYCDENKVMVEKNRAELRTCVDENIPILAKSNASAYEVSDAIAFKCLNKINEFADTIHEASLCNTADNNNVSLDSIRKILPPDSIDMIRKKGMDNAKNTILTNVVEYKSEN